METSSETLESEQMGHVCTTDTSWIFDEWSFDEWNDDWSVVGWHDGWEQTYDTSASSFSLGSLDLVAKSSPKRLERVKMSLGIGAVANTFLWNSGPEGAGDGSFYPTASGEWIPDGGAWQSQGYDETGFVHRSVWKTHWSAQSFAQCCRNRVQRTTVFHLGHDDGYMIPIYNKIGQEYGKNDFIPVNIENSNST